ncbi:cytochrome C oxidase subunit IV family protein [Marinicrinis sediminis]|uniref:Cytochrome C oxidase subunit IV family protein n=1 Tax=Marinicrinis sediminis TaxID=1652465 RepID=A0ABW5RF08_9BACL
MGQQQVTQQPASKVKRGPVHEGPRNHIITYAISMILTFIAFVAAANDALSGGFVIFLLVTMAMVQVIVQLAFWMHMKDKGHVYAFIALFTGFITALTAVAAALFLMWW